MHYEYMNYCRHQKVQESKIKLAHKFHPKDSIGTPTEDVVKHEATENTPEMYLDNFVTPEDYQRISNVMAMFDPRIFKGKQIGIQNLHNFPELMGQDIGFQTKDHLWEHINKNIIGHAFPIDFEHEQVIEGDHPDFKNSLEYPEGKNEADYIHSTLHPHLTAREIGELAENFINDLHHFYGKWHGVDYTKDDHMRHLFSNFIQSRGIPQGVASILTGVREPNPNIIQHYLAPK